MAPLKAIPTVETNECHINGLDPDKPRESHIEFKKKKMPGPSLSSEMDPKLLKILEISLVPKTAKEPPCVR